MYSARYLRTTLALWNSQGFPNYIQGPSTSMFAINIFVSMCARDLSRYSLSTPKTRLLTYLLSLWHKMTFNVIVAPCAASDLSQATNVRECYKIRVLWYLLTVLNYQSHLITLRSQKESHLIPSRIRTFHIISYCGISIVSSQKLPDTLRISHASQSHRFESCQNHFLGSS